MYEKYKLEGGGIHPSYKKESNDPKYNNQR